MVVKKKTLLRLEYGIDLDPIWNNVLHKAASMEFGKVLGEKQKLPTNFLWVLKLFKAECY